MNRLADEWEGGWVDRRQAGRRMDSHGWTDGRTGTDGRTSAPTDGRMGRWKVGWTDKKSGRVRTDR